MSRELVLQSTRTSAISPPYGRTASETATFDLANTNKLIRWYDGATGLKTGYTASAGYCISATAEREGMELIAVVMKRETSDKRNTDAKALLNYGFSAYTLVSAAPEEPLALPVTMGRGGAGGPDAAGDGRYRCGGEGAGIVAGVSGGPAGDLAALSIQQVQQVGTLTLCSGDTEVADGTHSGGGERSGAQLGTDVHRSFEAGGVLA